MTSQIVDMSDAAQKQDLLRAIQAMSGAHRVEICRFRPRRSDRQNKYYWPCVVVPLAEWLSEQQGGVVEEDEAHALLKSMFLRKPLVNHDTGELIAEITRSTTDLDTGEFAYYLDQCIGWLRGLGIHMEAPR